MHIVRMRKNFIIWNRDAFVASPGPYIPNLPWKAKWKEPTLNYNTAQALLDSKQDLLLLEFASLSQEAWSCAKELHFNIVARLLQYNWQQWIYIGSRVESFSNQVGYFGKLGRYHPIMESARGKSDVQLDSSGRMIWQLISTKSKLI